MTPEETSLLAQVKNVIELLKPEFDSHDFIQKYIKHFPASYGELLKKHDNVATAHSEIARFLSNHTKELKIEQLLKTASPNILGNETENTQWRKISL